MEDKQIKNKKIISDDKTSSSKVFSERSNFRKSTRKRKERTKSEFDQKILQIRRVTRVAAGGRRFSFSVAIVLGDRKGRVGIGTGKATDTALAIEKAINNAKKEMITINLTDSGSISHPVKAKYCSSQVFIQPSPGKGLVAGSAVRDVLSFLGAKDIVAKIISGSKNKLNNGRAAIKALEDLSI